ncbi:aldo/keto reductase family protein [Paenibacillus sp. PAMC21692]|uniref:aldo/keto reductase family protein n=1 Tax=Paenibacillus sp. PAMC21692 TaxID=2762320 RepID=UPI00164E684A|nr:aldo/keto reductase family protein [Paenibacillus sp. PAMC21692]QNK55838.1 aldo/keto reductase family protein [Paenibacillus sp. PAMC21692]
MQYRRLGNSGLKVSEISLGSWLTVGAASDSGLPERIIDRAYGLGINLFDTANVYHLGEAERIVGRALAKYERSSYVLATKVCVPMGDGPNDRGLSRKHIREQCDLSLKRLGVDYIDLYQCHRYDPDTPLDETLRALDDLVKAGKVLYTGVSMWKPAQIVDAVRTGSELNLNRIVSSQPQYHMLLREPEQELIPLCEREGVGQIVFSPLAQGALTGKYEPGRQLPPSSRAVDPKQNGAISRWISEDNLKRVQRLKPIADQTGLSLAQLALAWILRLPSVASCIVGASRPEQIEHNARASGIKLDAATLNAIDSALDLED